MHHKRLIFFYNSVMEGVNCNTAQISVGACWEGFMNGAVTVVQNCRCRQKYNMTAAMLMKTYHKNVKMK